MITAPDVLEEVTVIIDKWEKDPHPIYKECALRLRQLVQDCDIEDPVFQDYYPPEDYYYA